MTFDKIVEQEIKELDVLIEVTAKRKRVVRGGKVIRKRKCPKGYKLKGGNRCVRQSAREKQVRKRAGRKSARKGKAARKRNFKRSTRLRQRRHLKRTPR